MNELIDKQDQEIENCANELYAIHNTLRSSQLPLLDLYSAIDVLGTGSYRGLPTVIKTQFNLPSVPSKNEQQSALDNMESLIHKRIICDEILPKQFMQHRTISNSFIIIENGCVYFKVPREFSVALTMFLSNDLAVWQIKELHFDFAANAQNLIDQGRINAIIQEAQNQLNSGTGNFLLYNLFKQLHRICLNYKLQTLSLQANQLEGQRWKNILSVFRDDIVKISFWSFGNSSNSGYVLQLFATHAEEHDLNPDNAAIHFVQILSSNSNSSLKMKLLKNNSAVNDLSNLMLNKDDVFIESADLETILFQVTDTLAAKIVKGWQEKLVSEGFKVSLVEAKLAEYSFANFLEIQIDDSQKLVVKMNPRSGYVSLDLSDYCDGVEDLIISPVIRILEDRINLDYDSMENVCKTVIMAVT